MTKTEQSVFIFFICLLSWSSINAQVELINERSMNSKVYDLQNGQKQAVMHLEPIHYLTNGSWEPISTDILPTIDGFENKTNAFKTTFPNDIAPNKFVTLEMQSGAVINIGVEKVMVVYNNGTMTSVSSSPPNSIASANRSTINYPNIYPNISDNYEVLNGSLKNEVILSTLPSSLGGVNSGYYGFKETIELPSGWTMESLTGISSGLINMDLIIKNALGDGVLKIPAPIFFDNVGQTSDGSSQVNGSFFLEKNGNAIELTTLVPVSWLKESTRQFPVVMDPTTVIITGFDGGWISSNNLVNNPNYAFVGVCCGNLMHRAWIRFNTSIIPDASNVTLTELELVCVAVGASSAERVWVNDVTGAHGPYAGINPTVYADMGNGPYVDYIATTTGTTPFFNIGSQANTDVTASLASNFFQLALMFDDEPSTAWKRYVATNSRLRVTYGPILLPAKLSSYEVTCDNNATRIDWTTESETDLDYFSLEKSEDGINFTEFGMIKSAENSTTAVNYESTDANPYSGITYYRLKMLHKNGTVNYSEIRAINCGKELTSVVIAPNPTNHSVKVEFVQQTDAEAEIMLMNNLGKVLRKFKIEAKAGTNLHELDLSEHPVGVYLLTIKNGNQQAIRKIIKE